MGVPHVAPPNLPAFMTWEELELLPEEIAGQIELWNGRVVWARRGPAEHQDFTNLLWSSLRRCARQDMQDSLDHCWRVSTETNIFFGETGKSDYVTPDFLIYRCLEQEFQDIRAADVYVAGEVISPSNPDRDIEAKKARYARAGIAWYWEVLMGHSPRRIKTIRAYALETGHGKLPAGVTPLHSANYIIAGEWRSGAPDADDIDDGSVHNEFDSDGITFDFPFPIRIPWTELEY
ncbi:Uma2 family endonuclease [Nocardia coffeae]|uniref:Uma2 family endonuclease n=1 Tax=Nocardia coffeae TaxID=2873381 RepID=UPI001F3DE02F|nr:Uma2 family endonuclease [Nocardia coffeae]